MFSSEESKGEGNGELCDLTKRIGDLVFGASVEAPPTQASQVRTTAADCSLWPISPDFLNKRRELRLGGLSSPQAYSA